MRKCSFFALSLPKKLTMITNRILKEYRELEDSCVIVFLDGDQRKWQLTTAISTPCFPAAIQITIVIEFPGEYPFKIPRVSLVDAMPFILPLNTQSAFKIAMEMEMGPCAAQTDFDDFGGDFSVCGGYYDASSIGSIIATMT